MKTLKNPVVHVANRTSVQVDKPSCASGIFIMKNQDEIWKDIIGYEGLYQVSNLGRVKSLFRVIEYSFKNGISRNKKIREIVMSPSGCRGYNGVNLRIKQTPRKFRVCRLVAIAFIPNPDNKPCVNHIDGNKSNDCVSNLEWVTYSENMYHALNTGLHVPIKGADKYNAIKIKCTKTNKVFFTIKDAAIFVNTNQGHLSRMLRGIYKNKTSLVYA